MLYLVKIIFIEDFVMSKKVKLPITEQVSYMRDHCGIQFEICPEDDAVKFLRNSNYIFDFLYFMTRILSHL